MRLKKARADFKQKLIYLALIELRLSLNSLPTGGEDLSKLPGPLAALCPPPISPPSTMIFAICFI